MSNFQIVVIGIFIVFIIAGVLTFASFGGFGGGGTSYANVTVWGTLPQETMDNLIKKNTINAVYVEKDPATFESDFVNALAEGSGPDVVLLPQNLILKEQSKILTIPYASYSDRTFKDTFVQEGELFETPTGILGLPFTVDPLVMYWNRDLFNSAAVAVPPAHWDDFYDLSTKLTIKDQSSIIHQSAVSFGEYDNVDHAKDILAAMILQTGNNMIGSSDNGPVSTLSDKMNQDVAPAEAALTYYTGFADPLKAQYAWNRSLPDSKAYFLSGNLATYFGYASEFPDLQTKNPNLNFDVALLPQARDTASAATFGNMTALAILKNTKNSAAAFHAIGLFTTADSIAYLTTETNLPPVRRDLIAAGPTSAASTGALSTFYTAALQSKGWLDPDISGTEAIFKTMIESVTSGQDAPSEAVNSGSAQLGEILRAYATLN